MNNTYQKNDLERLTAELHVALQNVSPAPDIQNPGIPEFQWSVLSRYWNALQRMEQNALPVPNPDPDPVANPVSHQDSLEPLPSVEASEPIPDTAILPPDPAEPASQREPAGTSDVVLPVISADSDLPIQATDILSATISAPEPTVENPPPPQPTQPPAPGEEKAPDMPVPVFYPIRHERTSEILPNAMVGRPLAYQPKINLEQGFQIVSCEPDNVASDLGLSFDIATSTLSGAPTQAGAYAFTLVIVAENAAGNVISTRWQAEITINPDPKSLWKDLPSDRADMHWKPDTDTNFIEAGQNHIVAASKRGRSHAHEGKFRDDHFDIAYFPENGWSIITVADGAGSAPLSRHGSLVATQTVTTELTNAVRKNLDADIEAWTALHKEGNAETTKKLHDALYASLAGAFFTADRTISRYADGLNLPRAQFATTLICVIHRMTKAGHFIAAFAIGDGGAAIFDIEANTVTPLTVPDSGEYAGQTRFLTASEFADPKKTYERIKFQVVDRFTAVIAMTDGITDPKFPTDAQFANVNTWKTFWADDITKVVDFSTDLSADQLLGWLDFWSPGNHDDRTIAVLTRK